MTFKEFSAWCDQRACDGMWGMNTALVCMGAGTAIMEKPFWAREMEWKKLNAESRILEDTKMFKVTHWMPLPAPPEKGAEE